MNLKIRNISDESLWSVVGQLKFVMMHAPNDPSIAIESYFDQIKDAVEFAEAGNSPFTASQITTKACIQMFAMGLYKDECKAWNYIVPQSSTWAIC